MEHSEWNEFLETGLECLELATKESLKYFGTKTLMRQKSDKSWVTEVDESIEALQRALIMARHPKHKILGEELGGGWSADQNGYTWVLDPIDGTFSFMNAIPFYSSLVCLFYNKTPVLGLAGLPSLGIKMWGVKEQGAYIQKNGEIPKNAKDLRLTGEGDLIAIADPYRFVNVGKEDVLKKLILPPNKTRIYPDALGYYLLLTGGVKCFVDPKVKIWDVAPFHVILPEADFLIHSWEGPEIPFGQNSVAYSSWFDSEIKNHLEILRLSQLEQLP